MIQESAEEFPLQNESIEFDLTQREGVVKELKKRTGSIAYIRTEDDVVIGGFIHNVKGKRYIFPVPDPTLIYFNNAQLNIAAITKHKEELIKKVDLEETLSEPALNEIYNFYGVTSGFVIFLFTSIESFINQLLPDDFEYRNKLRRKTEIYNKQQIQESLDFKTKLKHVLPQATNKDFFRNQTPTNDRIWKLKEFRDEIVHTKPDKNPLKYDHLIKTSLNFKYLQTLKAVAKFMNHYKPDYIVECDCGMDF